MLARREGVSGFEGEQKLAQLISGRGWNALSVAVFVEMPERLMAKANNSHVIPSSLVCTVIPYMSSICVAIPRHQLSKR